MFAWDKPIKAGKFSQEHGREVIIEATPKEIIRSPNRFRTESILMAQCIVLSELVQSQELQAQRIQNMLNRGVTTEARPEENQLSLFDKTS